MFKLSFKILVCFLLTRSFPAECYEIDQMTLEEKVGQLFMAYFDGEGANECAERLIRETKIGGIIYYAWSNGLKDPFKVQKMSNDLQKLAIQYIGIPLFISADQEGGLVARLQDGFTEFPGNSALCRTEQPNLAYEASYYMGQELRVVGVNFNLAPVVDVNNNPSNPIIGIRSFGDDKEMVTNFGRASVQGFKDSGIIPCLKHFPGHGDVTVDSHKGLPVVNKSYSEIDNLELFPFKRLAENTPAIMTAHILFTQIDPKNCATLSPLILEGILREKLNFQGVLITDSLTMQGVLEGHANLEEVVLKAFEAGNDMLLIGGRDLQNQVDGESNIDEMVRICHSMIKAVRDGRISEERVNASVTRILKLKKESGLFDRLPLTNQDLVETLQKKDHLKLAHEIAYRSVQIQECDFNYDLSELNVAIVAPKTIENKIRGTDLMKLGQSVTLHTFKSLEPSAEECQKILENLKSSDYVVFCSYNSWKTPRQLELLRAVSKLKPTACIAVRDPYDLDVHHHSKVKIATYSPTSCSLQVVADWLSGKTKPLEITFEQAQDVGKKIWYNECNNRVDQLTFWSENEPFPSIGVGHFIWPPKDYDGIFSKGRFNSVIKFMHEQHIKIPVWISNAEFSPWTTREKFYNEFDSVKMKELRSFLVETVPYQARYMAERLNEAFSEIVISTPVEKRKSVINQFFEVGRQFNGPYILIDYLNFKHEGTNPKERYCGKGWGLQQVLESMTNSDADQNSSPEKSFAANAKMLLKQRVANSPNPQTEQKWLPGWANRLNTYYNLESDPCVSSNSN